MRKYVLYIMISLSVPLLLSAQTERAAYLEVINKRADKIVASLAITPNKKYQKVLEILVNQYDQLNAAHEDKIAKSMRIKTQFKADKAQESLALTQLEQKTASQVQGLHDKFLKALKKHLNADQLAQLKDGMTYSILPRTYQAYAEMIPHLNDTQKDYILHLLVEAREQAIDAPSADAKHAVFGKYKGRINNYLSQEGYDLKLEGDRWKERIRQQEVAQKNKP